MIRVCYIAGEPNPYRAPHLDLIAAHPDIDLTVVYAAATVQRRAWELAYAHEPTILRGPRIPLTRILHHDYPLTPQIWGLLERGRFDVVVVGGWSLMAAQLAIVWARVRKVPYLIVSENHLREPRPGWVLAVKSLVLHQVVPQASGVLVAGSLAGEHALRYGARPDRITVFPNTVDIPAYRAAADRLRPQRAEIRRRLGIADDAVVVAHVGRLFPMKAPDELVEAVARARSFTDQRLHLVFAGDGELGASLERAAARMRLDATFTGFVQGEQLLECYASADVFALLSHRETWGVVVNEAAAFGLPLVLTDAVGASADLLRDGENGTLVPSGDIEGAARAIAGLADDPGLRQRYGRRSLELVEPWDYERSVGTFVEAVRTAASDRRR